jgi:hypothetical protein
MTDVKNHELDPPAEVVHLRRLLDIQPGCLMRVGADGMVLAANDAALMLLGGRSRAEALGRDFALWIPPDQHDRWRAFTLGVVNGSPSSIECDIAVPSGDRYPTLFHGVPLADHPDGVASMAVAARVISAQRQVEAVVGELREQLRERDAERLRAEARLAEADTQQRQLTDALEALEARSHERSASEEGQLHQLKAELQARDEALVMAEGARRDAEANRARALADVRQLEMAMNEFANRQRQMSAERQAEHENVQGNRASVEAALQQAQQALARSEQREQEAGTERDALQRRLEQALAACRDREAALLQLQADHEGLAATHAAATVERDRLASALREHAVHLEALANGIPCTGGGQVAAEASVASRAGREEQPA